MLKNLKKMLEDTYTAIDIGPNVTEFSMDLTYYYIPTNQFAPDQDLSTVATQGNFKYSKWKSCNSYTKRYD